MDTRQIFEEWYAGELPKALERNADGGYKYMPANTAWHVWQAAIAHEREECAISCDVKGATMLDQNRMVSAYVMAGECALAIRQRSNA